MVVVVREGSTDRPQAGPSPFKFKVNYGKATASPVYAITAQPSKQYEESHKATTMRLDRETWQALPGEASERQLLLPLDESTFASLPLVEVVLDPVGGWRGVLSERRAYVDIREQSGEAPTQMLRFGELATVQGMSISPKGDRIIYSVAAGMSDDELRSLAERQTYDQWDFPLASATVHGITIGPTGGGGVQQITTGGFRDLFPSFSPTGEHILITSNRRNRVGSDLLRLNAGGRGGIQNLLVDTGGNRSSKPTQGSDGTIAYSLYPNGSQAPTDAQIWTIGGPNEYPTQVSYGQLPAISPDGKTIAFIRNGNLWTCYASGGGETQLTFDAASIIEDYRESLPTDAERAYFDRAQLSRTFFPNGYPTWSPDGRHILFTSMQGRDATGRPNEDIWIIGADGTSAQQLTTNFSADRFPVVAPGGRYIYFFSNRGKVWGLWRIAAPAEIAGEG